MGFKLEQSGRKVLEEPGVGRHHLEGSFLKGATNQRLRWKSDVAAKFGKS